MDLSKAYELAEHLLGQHGLDDWAVTFDNAKRRAGACRWGRRTISLSAPLTRLHDAAEVEETILHEIAHALVGPEPGHGPTWQKTARRIGSSGERCVPEDAPRVAGDWLGVCPAGHTRERHKRPEKVLSCGKCSDQFSLAHVFEWTFRGRPAHMHPNYTEELEALSQGRRRVRLGVGAQVRIVAPGPYEGRTGVVVKRGRTRYHVDVGNGILEVVFPGVEPSGQQEVVIAGIGNPANRPEVFSFESWPDVSTSLPTYDGRFRTYRGKRTQQWIADKPEELHRLLTRPDVLRADGADHPAVRREATYLSPNGERLVATRLDDVGCPLFGEHSMISIDVQPDESDEPAWEDWYRVDRLLGEILQQAHARAEPVILTAVPSGFTVTCSFATVGGGQEVLFLNAPEIPRDDGVQGHDVWQRASKLRGEYSLACPISSDALRGAGRLAMVALRAQGYAPLDVVVGYPELG